MAAHPMVTTPLKGDAAAREKPAQQRTIATELPDELSRLPADFGFAGVNPFPKAAKSAANGSGPKSPRRHKAAAGPKTRPRAVVATTVFADDGHPTILAAPLPAK